MIKIANQFFEKSILIVELNQLIIVSFTFRKNYNPFTRKYIQILIWNLISNFTLKFYSLIRIILLFLSREIFFFLQMFFSTVRARKISRHVASFISQILITKKHTASFSFHISDSTLFFFLLQLFILLQRMIIKMLKLHAKFHGWRKLFLLFLKDFFQLSRVSRQVALARILTVISAHSDLPCMKSLAMDLATFLASIMCPEKNDVNREDFISELEEYGFLLIVEYNTFSIRLQWSAITKLAYPPKNVFQLFNKEQVEKFERYRSQRVEVSSNTFEITPSDSTLMLVKLLGYWMNKKCIVYYSFYYSIFRAEAVFYLLERTADYMTENDAITINQILEHCTSLLSWHLTDDIYGASQFGKSLVNLFYSLSHLIRAGADADKQETICMEFALSFIDITGSTEEALRNLENYVESRTSRLDVMDRKPRQLRICALRCLGLSLSTNESDYVLNSLDSILILRLKILQLTEECIFELDVLSSLISTQEMYANTSVNESQLKEKNLPKKAAHVLWRLLLNLLRNFPSEILVEKICDVLSSGLSHLKKNWKFVCSSPAYGCTFLRAVLDIILDSNKDTNLCRKDSVLLAIMIRNVINNGTFAEVLQEGGKNLISVIFSHLHTELMKLTAEALSEILMVVDMLKETHNAKTFKNMALQFNMQKRKEIKI
uniref:Uncharacterized protein n=1 Tax=Wuchereria bancrofti TaxID=6293 RepID=A0AAF5Q5L5_WUCBA